MIDVNILKEHIEGLEPGQMVILNNSDGETVAEITRTQTGLFIGFSEPSQSYNALIHMDDPEIHATGNDLDIISRKDQVAWGARLMIYGHKYYSQAVVG